MDPQTQWRPTRGNGLVIFLGKGNGPDSGRWAAGICALPQIEKWNHAIRNSLPADDQHPVELHLEIKGPKQGEARVQYFTNFQHKFNCQTCSASLKDILYSGTNLLRLFQQSICHTTRPLYILLRRTSWVCSSTECFILGHLCEHIVGETEGVSRGFRN